MRKRSLYLGHANVIATIIDIGQAPDFIVSICEFIKRMAVDHLHLVGDIFDRGPRANIVMDSLPGYHSVDVQWGNDDAEQYSEKDKLLSAA